MTVEIYKATNKVNTKGYIGFTEITMMNRRRQHFYDVENGSSTHFHNAIRKYGENAFEWKILTECEIRKEAGKLETDLIEEHDTYRNGYNSTTGGECSWSHTPESREKISEAGRGRIVSLETRDKIRRSNLGRIPWNKGKTGVYSKKTIKRMSEAQKGKIVSEEAKRKNSESNKGRISWNKGIPHTNEAMQKMSLAHENKKRKSKCRS